MWVHIDDNTNKIVFKYSKELRVVLNFGTDAFAFWDAVFQTLDSRQYNIARDFKTRSFQIKNHIPPRVLAQFEYAISKEETTLNFYNNEQQHNPGN